MKSGNTVILPLKEKRINHLTGREEIMDTGMVAEFSQGRQVSSPFEMPSIGHVAQERAVPSSVSRPPQTHSAALHCGETRSLAQHYQRPGETTQQAAERLGEAASRFEVSGNRATAMGTGSPVGGSYAQPETVGPNDPRAHANSASFSRGEQ